MIQTDGTYTLAFPQIGKGDLARVGGKCASLGEMTQAGVAVPPGFAVTTDGYLAMLDKSNLRAEIERHLASVDVEDLDSLDRAAQAIRIRIRSHRMPEAVETALNDVADQWVAALASAGVRARGRLALEQAGGSS